MLLLIFIRAENNLMSRTSGYIPIFCVALLFLITLFFPVMAKSEQLKPINGPLTAFFNSSSDRVEFAGGVEEDLSPFSFMIKLYKRYLSPVNSSRCPMYPSCSSFASQALRYHGEKGLVMAFDRLLRCGRDLEDYPLVLKSGRVLRYDPVIQTVERNTDDSPK